MAKKIKPNKLFEDEVLAPASEQDDDSSQTASMTEAEKLGADPNPVIGNGRVSSADLEKLEKFDALEQSLAEAVHEKETLESKITEYVEKLEALKDAADEIEKLKKENESLKSRCSSLESNNSNAALERDISDLREENNKYLVRISELTFENANLTCQLAELEKAVKQDGSVSNQPKFQPGSMPGGYMPNGLAKPMKDAYNPYVNNGYGTW